MEENEIFLKLAMEIIISALTDPIKKHQKTHCFYKGKIKTEFLIEKCEENIEFARKNKIITLYCDACREDIDDDWLRLKIIRRNQEYIKKYQQIVIEQNDK